jgi:hypothetical protein
MSEKEKKNLYLTTSVIKAAEEKREKTKTFKKLSPLVDALLDKYSKGEIVFK